eukprot:4875784-Karenia_brevis.AAC.1
MVTALRAGPPGDQFTEDLFDSSTTNAMNMTSAMQILQGPQAHDFGDEAKSAKAFMLKEGLLDSTDAEQDRISDRSKRERY